MKPATVLRALAGTPKREARAWSSTTLGGMGFALRSTSDLARPASLFEAQSLGAFHACLSYIADTIACMAVDVVRSAEGRRLPVAAPQIVADPHPAPQITAAMWLAQVVRSLRSRGNAFGLVTSWAASGWPERIEPIDPGLVHYEARDGGRWWVYGDDRRRTEVRLWQDGGVLWHVPYGLEAGQVIGVDVVSRAAIDLGLAHAARQYGADFYWSGGHPTAILEAGGVITPAQAAAQQKDWVDQSLRSPRQPRVIGGMTYKPLQITPDQAMLLDAMRASSADICRWFDVPPEEIGLSSGDSLTYANVEGRSLQALRKLTPTIRTVQDAWSALLPNGQAVRLVPETLLMTTVQLKHRIIADDVRGGLISPNEGRALLDLAPFDGADQLLWPPQTTTAPGGKETP